MGTTARHLSILLVAAAGGLLLHQAGCTSETNVTRADETGAGPSAGGDDGGAQSEPGGALESGGASGEDGRAGDATAGGTETGGATGGEPSGGTVPSGGGGGDGGEPGGGTVPSGGGGGDGGEPSGGTVPSGGGGGDGGEPGGGALGSSGAAGAAGGGAGATATGGAPPDCVALGQTGCAERCCDEGTCIQDLCVLAECRGDDEPCTGPAECCGASVQKCLLGECGAPACRTVGSNCNDDFPCCDDAYCASGNCYARRAEGVSCSSDEQCLADLTCDVDTGQCAPCPLCVGAPCCGSCIGGLCNPTVIIPFLCFPDNILGDPCGGPPDCCTDHCVSGACADFCFELGDACSTSAECCSGTCRQNLCVYAGCGEPGDACTSSTNCCSNRCDATSRCE